jgi:hypothetical protein
MSKLTCHIPMKPITPIIISIVLVLGILVSGISATPEGDGNGEGNGDGKSEDEGFAIYLTKQDIPPAQMEDLSHVDIAEEPIITISDIITYDAQEHELILTASAFERVSQLDVPTRGKSFIVCVDKAPIYWGAFWVPWSSLSFDGVILWKPLSLEEPHIIRLELGYPSSELYTGEDPRSNPVVMESLEQAGKLITGPLAAVDELPHFVKGYELYSWLEDGQWHFTLITGTDRNKTVEEIISREDVISETGWVRVQVIGVNVIRAALSKLHQGEEIVWLARPRSEQTPPDDIDFMFPPEQIIDSVKEQAEQSGLDLLVQALS